VLEQPAPSNAGSRVAGPRQQAVGAERPSVAPRRIRRLLVANRGEIASRIMRTARALGIQTVAVHSDPDARAPFVGDALFSVPLGGRTSAESYLDVGKVLDAARRSGADAIHPGYGFLSENPRFAQAVTDAGLVWIGPTPEQMRAMALKVESKRLVAGAGVPLVPGAELASDASAEQIGAAAEQVGFPLLVKASAGGGGKGMRLVRDPSALVDEVSAARNEASSAFGDPTVFLERYLERSRHVEVQVFGDAHGNVVHLFERECSIQRRHQKVVEESPSPGATPATLAGMYDAAVAAARAIGYHGAGTVEFIVAGEGQAQEFYFLEMNTRLQVEHPVTEATTGLDLVEWQIRVARGEALPLAQEQITRRGHAIEVRLYAEDPANGYLPNTGRIEWFDDADRPDVRVDSGVRTGSEVSPYYDPMLAKVIGSGETREDAADTLAECLSHFEVAGVRTNRESLAAVLRSPAFLAGDTTTAFLEEHPELLAPVVPEAELARTLVVGALGVAHAEALDAPWTRLAPLGWRNVPAVPEVRRFAVPASGGLETTVEVHVQRDRAGAWVQVAGLAFGDQDMAAGDVLPSDEAVSRSHGTPDAPVSAVPASVRLRVEAESFEPPNLVSARFDGLRSGWTVQRVGDFLMIGGPERALTVRVLPRYPDASDHAHDHGLATPVPGTVTQVLVAAGDAVTAGDTLVILEAMKMEHRIKADTDGVVEEIRVDVGDSVDAHHVVAVLEEP
jgi:acyl-CoA carboxylase subunit alpha